MKIAYCVIPESGGLFSFYLNLKKALAPYGWELLAPCVGPSARNRWDDNFADESCHLIAPDEQDPRKAAQELAEWIENSNVSILMPMDSSIAASALPHLGSDVRIVTRCSTVSDFGFRISLLCPERLSRAVVMTPAQEAGLKRYPGSEDRVVLIPHGVDVDKIRGESVADENVLRLLYLGRLEDRSKGVLFLPEIISRLNKVGIVFELDIIGDGVDRSKLERRFASMCLDDSVSMIGALTKEHVATRLNTVHYDVLIMPSRYEGFPNALLEAMAAGIVPVVSRLDGIEGFIIDDKCNGMLCGIGKPLEFASAIEVLANNSELHKSLAEKARQTVERRFSLQLMEQNYDCLFSQVLAEGNDVVPIDWADFNIDRNFIPSWRRFVPQSIKNYVRRFIRV